VNLIVNRDKDVVEEGVAALVGRKNSRATMVLSNTLKVLAKILLVGPRR
jgi:hypothetical protein